MAMKGKAAVAEAPVAEIKAEEPKLDPKTDSGAAAAVARLQKSAEKKVEQTGKTYGQSNDSLKQERILIQGTVQAVVESPFVAGMKIKGGDGGEEYIKTVFSIADRLIAGIRERSPM